MLAHGLTTTIEPGSWTIEYRTESISHVLYNNVLIFNKRIITINNKVLKDNHFYS